MDCSSDRIHALVDGELAPNEQEECERHLAGCPACSETRAQLLDLRSTVRSGAPRYSASGQLRKAVDDLIREPKPVLPAREPWKWLAIAATVLLAISLGWNVLSIGQSPRQPDVVAEMVMSDHIRALMGTHLLDVPSTDQHTVKPWFNGKVDFSPDVKDFAAEGYPLIGGRLEYLNDRTVAALVYQRRKHIISLFTWPSGGATPSDEEVSRNGFHALHWTAGGMTYWAVSDVSAADLSEFEQLYRK